MGKASLTQFTGFLLLSALIAVPGCGNPNRKTIAVIPETTGVEFWEAEHVGAERAAKETGYHVYWNAPTRDDNTEQQVQLVEAATQAGDGGVVLAPDHELALITPVRRALERQLPVVVIRSPLNIPPEGKLAYILNDEEETGRIAANRIAELMKGRPGAVAVVGFNPALKGIDDRRRSFESNMASTYPQIETVEYPSSPLDPEQMRDTVSRILNRSPRIGAVFALDVPTTSAILSILTSSRQAGRVALIGCDQDLNLMAALRAGIIDSIVVEDTHRMGYEAVREVAAVNAGKGVPPILKVSPVLVTKENIDSRSVQGMLDTDWRISP